MTPVGTRIRVLREETQQKEARIRELQESLTNKEEASE